MDIERILAHIAGVISISALLALLMWPYYPINLVIILSSVALYSLCYFIVIIFTLFDDFIKGRFPFGEDDQT
jgi:hypothetical protein